MESHRQRMLWSGLLISAFLNQFCNFLDTDCHWLLMIIFKTSFKQSWYVGYIAEMCRKGISNYEPEHVRAKDTNIERTLPLALNGFTCQSCRHNIIWPVPQDISGNSILVVANITKHWTSTNQGNLLFCLSMDWIAQTRDGMRRETGP